MIQIVLKDAEALKVYENNPRKNDDAVKPLMDSIKEFGFKVPILIDKNNVIIAGHTRLKAAKKLGMIKVPCICCDDLSDEAVRTFRVIDNKTTEFAQWDILKLKEELEKLSDVDFEYDFGCLKELLNEEVDIHSMFSECDTDKLFKEDNEQSLKQVQCPFCGEWCEI